MKAGDRAKFWFLTDLPDVVVPFIHVVTRQKRGGGEYTRDLLCAKTDLDDPTPCELCDETGQAPYRRSVFYVFVTEVLHAERKGKGSEAWEAVRAGGSTYYREVVNGVRLLSTKPRLESQILEVYDGDPLAEDYETAPKTLLDRWFVVKRTAERNSTETLQYPEQPTPMPDAVRALVDEARLALPSLGETVEAQFTERQRTTATGGSASRASRGTSDTGGFDPDEGSGGSGYVPGDDDLEDLPF